MIIKYINSNGISFNLECDNLKIKEGNFHKNSWKAKVEEARYGDTVKSFSKQSIIYEITLTLRGKIEERKRLLDNLHDASEFDIVQNAPGAIWFGEYYIKCFITLSDTHASQDLSYRTDKKIEIYCPYPFWIKESTKQFLPQSSTDSTDGLDFPFDFAFDFAPEQVGVAKWSVDHYAPSDFQMIIYGPCSEPKILINRHPYQIHTELEASDYLVIDSRKNTVTKYMANGTTANLYNSRNFKYRVFEKIPAGDLTINWSGNFGFDITLYLERSEPKWGTDDNRKNLITEAGAYLVTE